MSDQSRSLHVRGVLSDYFTLEGHIASTRSADAYRAVHKARSASVCLWMLRHPLSTRSDAVARFMDRLRQIQELKSPLCQVLDFGVDSSGMAYAVLPPLDGTPLLGSAQDVTELERRFTACVRLVEKLHSVGVVCGDISPSSFWVSRTGDIWLTGVMGSFDAEAAATAVMPPIETLQYVSPEQRAGGAVEQASDVFALGVLGYYLFTGHFPFGDNSSVFSPDLDLGVVTPLSNWIPNPPAWGDEVLLRCLDPAVERRFPSAGAVLQGMVEVRQRILSESELPVGRGRREIILKRRGTGADAPAAVTGPGLPEKGKLPAGEPETNGSVQTWKLVLTALLIFIASLLLAWRLLDAGNFLSGSIPGLSIRPEAASGNPQMQQAISVLSGPQGVVSEMAAKLAELVVSDDPLAHEILVKSASEASLAEMRALSEKAIIDRTRRLGSQRAAEQARLWLRTVPVGEVPPSYEPLLRALNPNLPASGRDAALREAYATEPKVALRIAAALALDSKQIQDYQVIMAQLVGDSLGSADAARHSVLGLILAQPDLALVFSEDVVARKADIPDADLGWVLSLLADRNDLNVRAFAELAVEKGTLPPVRSMFLKTVSERGDMPPEVLNVLVRAAAGSLVVQDLSVFGRWYDEQAEKLLLAICADAPDEKVRVEAFEVLAGKSLSTQPAATLTDWVRRNVWEKRAEFARSVGVLGSLELYPFEKARDSLTVFDPYLKRSPGLLKALIDVGDPRLTRLLIERYSNSLGYQALLNMLGHKDPNVRIMVIRALKGYNDVSALKTILDYYEKEKDPEVKKEYKQSFWMLDKRQL